MARGEQVSIMARVALVLGLVALCTLHKLHNVPVWDDVQNLEWAAVLRKRDPWRVFASSTLQQVMASEGDGEPAQDAQLDLYRPLALLSFAGLDALAPGSALPQHLANTILHLLCVWLVFLHARRLFALSGEPRVSAERHALIAATWFGLAPVLIEAHVWISGRFDLLSASLGLLGLLLLSADREQEGPARAALRSFAAFAALLLGMLAKEPLLFALPAIVLWPRARPAGLVARVRASGPALAAAAVYLLARARVLHGVAGLEPSAQRLRALFNAPLLLLDGAFNALVPLAIYPRALNEDYAALGVAAVVAAGLAVVLLGALLWRARRTMPVAMWCGLWFTCTLGPAALTTGSLWPGFGRHLYLPLTFGLIGAVALGAKLASILEPHLRSPQLLRWAVWGYLALLGVRSANATFDWADEPTLFSSVIEAAPDRSHGYGLLGITFNNRKRYAQAVPLLARACELAPEDRRWASRLGTALLFSGRRREALALAERWIAKLDDAPEFHLLAAYATLDSDVAASSSHVLLCLKQEPTHAQCREALTFLWSQHAQAPRYRAQLGRLLAQREFASLATLIPHEAP